jgi:HK97 gp10 family phage protein
MQTFRVGLSGVGPTLKKLKRVEDKLQKRVLGKAVRDGAAIIARAMVAKAPKETHTLAVSIDKRDKWYRRRTVLFIAVGPATKAGRETPLGYRLPTKYVHLIEFGTRHAPAQPFLRPAFDENADRVKQAIIDRIVKALARV